MDEEQEQLQFLSFIGIFKESIKIILSRPKIFAKISLAFILPLTFFSLADVEISKLLTNEVIVKNASALNAQVTSTTHRNNALFWGLKAVYIILSLIFSLLSISAVVYTVACIYTAKEITFKKIVSVIPKVWKRLVITLVSNFCIIFAYIFACGVVVLLCSLIFIFGIKSKPSDLQVEITIITIIMIIVISLGVIYMAIFWQLANVISVMEKHYGFKAMKKSRQLIKGKLGTAIAIFLVLSICYGAIGLLIEKVVKSDNVGIGLIILYGILSFVLDSMIMLYSLVVHSVFYFVCKSYHHENITKSSLVNHLEAFQWGYVPLRNGDVEIERLDV